MPLGPVSLLVIGDTGKPISSLFAALRPQYQVARALAAEDARAEVHGLVLLGDNFYPHGLVEDGMKDRLRVNVVGPYCRFLALTDRGLGSLGASCRVLEAHRHPIPWYVVLGNHDYSTIGSPQLQKEVVPAYLKSWLMPEEVDVHELPGGLSLIPFHSMPIVGGKNEGLLVDALRRSKGPFRILAAHHPIADPGHGYEPEYARRVRAAIAEAGVPVHLFLSGHEHSLQVIAGNGEDDAALHVISGAGSDTRKMRSTDRERLFEKRSLGFVRVDLIEDADEASLLVTVIGVSSIPGTGPEALAYYRITQAGAVHSIVPVSE